MFISFSISISNQLTQGILAMFISISISISNKILSVSLALVIAIIIMLRVWFTILLAHHHQKAPTRANNYFIRTNVSLDW